MFDNEGNCYACGDSGSQFYNSRVVCRDCFLELTLGVICNQNIHFCGGRGTKDDDSPWQENAVRALEDGRF